VTATANWHPQGKRKSSGLEKIVAIKQLFACNWVALLWWHSWAVSETGKWQH